MFSLNKVAQSGHEKRRFYFIRWGILSSFQICMVYIGFYGRLLFFQDLFTDNTKMPKNRLPVQPL